MWARWWAHLALIDVLMLTGIAAGAVWLACTHLTAMHPPAALLVSALAAVATLSVLAQRRQP
ncbi:hypothetical protein [Actinomadura sp. 6N118]|uniref:hypothetical protein n=1 Tax=Actinomadura sp. 6N118 TaxID=3375151 RepID=UPI0037BB0220